MWYNEGRKIVVSGGAVNTPDRIHSWRNVPMPTLPPHDLEDNPQIYTVYALIDPRDQAVRYIGVTDEVYERTKLHMHCDGKTPRKDAWIQELKREQVVFIMHSLEHLETWEDAVEREYHWIQHYYSEGAALLNTEGDLSIPPRPIYTGKFTSKEQEVAAILARQPGATPEQVAQEAGCNVRTAEKWMKRLQGA